MFKGFGANIFIFRLFDVFVYTIVAFFGLPNAKTIKNRKTKAILYTLIFHYFSYDLVTGGASYNTLAVLFVLIGTYYSLKEMASNKFIILNGILMYLIFFTKQNIGAYYVIATILVQTGMIEGRNKKVIFNILKTIRNCFLYYPWEPWEYYIYKAYFGILLISHFWEYENLVHKIVS